MTDPQKLAEEYVYSGGSCSVYDAYLAGYKKGGEWVRIEDKLPPVMEYIICFDQREVHTRLFSRAWEKLTFEEFKAKCPVTHWQPLPSPPKNTDNG